MPQRGGRIPALDSGSELNPGGECKTNLMLINQAVWLYSIGDSRVPETGSDSYQQSDLKYQLIDSGTPQLPA